MRVGQNPFKTFTERAYLGDWSANPERVVIHGAGASGLMLATLLKAKGFTRFRILGRGQPGGLIQTTQTQYGLREWAANGFLSGGRGMNEILSGLDLKTLPSRTCASAKFVVRNGKLVRLPQSFGDFRRQPFLSWKSKCMLPLRVAKFMVAGRVDPSSTLAEFAASVGGREVSRTLAEAMVAGVYAGSAEEICVGAAFPRLLSRFGPKAERKHLGARGELTSFTRGMGTWTRAMADFVKGFFAESAGDFNAPGTLHVVTVPAFELCHMELLAGETELARLSEQVVYAPVISINMFARKKDFHHLPNGFGVLIPPGEPYRALGVLFNHDIFENRAQPEQVSLNFMYGGRRDPELTQLSDAELRELVQEEARRLFSFDGRALEIDVLRIPRAIPQYTRKLGEMWGHAHHYLETRNQENPAPVVLFGNYTGQVALRGMADGALGLVQKILSTSQSPSYS